tara:strand:+ start:473 stop:928 length:456 start_codon:yes stop_codon:yes gene_type:complete
MKTTCNRLTIWAHIPKTKAASRKAGKLHTVYSYKPQGLVRGGLPKTTPSAPLELNGPALLMRDVRAFTTAKLKTAQSQTARTVFIHMNGEPVSLGGELPAGARILGKLDVDPTGKHYAAEYGFVWADSRLPAGSSWDFVYFTTGGAFAVAL